LQARVNRVSVGDDSVACVAAGRAAQRRGKMLVLDGDEQRPRGLGLGLGRGEARRRRRGHDDDRDVTNGTRPAWTDSCATDELLKTISNERARYDAGIPATTAATTATMMMTTTMMKLSRAPVTASACVAWRTVTPSNDRPIVVHNILSFICHTPAVTIFLRLRRAFYEPPRRYVLDLSVSLCVRVCVRTYGRAMTGLQSTSSFIYFSFSVLHRPMCGLVV